MQKRNREDTAESVVERVYRAVRHLATGQGDVRARLCIAGFILIALKADEFPPELRADFRWVFAQLTRHDPIASEGRIVATMKRIQNSTGEKIAIRIFDIYSRLQAGRGHPLL